MAKNMNKLVLATLVVVAALLQSSWAQTTHVVGDAMGWVIPPGGPVAYATWAAKYTFTVGDVLVFNYTTGDHDVAEVTKAAFNDCNATSPISISTTGPTNITLTSAGEHHYICTIGNMCNLGQKLAINVSAAAPPPPPAAATPPSAPPSSSAETHVVGGPLGWNVLANGDEAYKAWAANNTFVVGDTLVFNFVNESHNVAEVTKSAYDSCNTTTPISLATSSPVRITLTTAGEHFFTCSIDNHCSLGQKLAINVTATTPTPTPSPVATPTPTQPPMTAAPTPSPTATPPPAAAPTPSTTATPPTASTPPPSTTATPPPAPTPSGTTTPSTPPPPMTDTTTPPPPPNSAPALAGAALPVALLSIAVALLH